MTDTQLTDDRQTNCKSTVSNQKLVVYIEGLGTRLCISYSRLICLVSWARNEI